MEQEQTFSRFLACLRAGDNAAAIQVFDRFARRLIRLAGEQMAEAIRRKVEPEDIVQSVYRSFFTRNREGQFELVNWDSVWGILTTITMRKCINRAEYFQAQCRDVRREYALESAGESGRYQAHTAMDREPTPLEAAILTEEVERVMTGLDERERQILSLHLQGNEVPEISSVIGRSERTVQRTLERIRKELETAAACPA